MKDFLGQELQVGDVVVTVMVGYRTMRCGTIGKICPKQVRVDFYKHGTVSDTFMTNPDFVVKVNAIMGVSPNPA